MEFSSKYRQEVCTGLQTLLQMNTAEASQITYFFKGSPPAHDVLINTIEDEWRRADPITPDNEASRWAPDFVGKIHGFMASLEWHTEEETRALPNVYEAPTMLEVSVPVAVVGKRQAVSSDADLLLTGIDADAQDVPTLTWALTLWGNDSQSTHGYYIMHHVGTALDPNSEIILWSPTVANAQTPLPLRQVYSPIL